MDKSVIANSVERFRDLILEIEDHIWKHPETGYKEWNTQKYLASKYEELGYKVNYVGNIPGFYVDVQTGRPGPRILVMGELDSVICTTHPDADPVTGAVHACGHHAQSAALFGIAAALKNKEVTEGLSGSVRLFAVPAEELLELKEREDLRRKGIIRYYGGKTELMYRGLFDDCDIAFMVHTTGGDAFVCNRGQNGCIVKNIRYKGVSSHAGGSPNLGVNALYAANLGMNAVNALRETFLDSDHIRFHPIINYGGTSVNAIPDVVTMESYVRGASLESIIRENRKINRALAGSALSIGANVEVLDRPGYAPLINDPGLLDVAFEAVGSFLGEDRAIRGNGWSSACTDMGDVASVMPAIQPCIGGAVGKGHGANYRIESHELACVVSAEVQLSIIYALLENSAAKSKEVLDRFKPIYPSKESFFKAVDSNILDSELIEYGNDGKGAVVRF